MKADNLRRRELARMIDQAFLRPEAAPADLLAACELARKYHVGCLCVRPCDVPAAIAALRGSGVKVGTVVGFPHGVNTPSVKAAEAARAVADGAEELDMVINIGRLIAGNVDFVRNDIAAVVAAAAGRPVKVILECCYLTRNQMAAGCKAALEDSADRIYAFFNNCHAGQAARNAQQFQKIVRSL